MPDVPALLNGRRLIRIAGRLGLESRGRSADAMHARTLVTLVTR